MIRNIAILSLFIFTLSLSANEACDYGKLNQCSESKTCVKIDKDISECRKFEDFLPFVLYPYPEKRAILCDQGVESSLGNSHSFINTIYALDLKTPKWSEPEGIKAGVDGMAYVFNGCVKHNTSCGDGWGNHVRIFTRDKVVIQYAHLEKIWIQTGQLIKENSYIGLEGTTGLTGRQNRHLHISVHYRTNYSKEDFFKGYLPKSIPFKMNICQQRYGTCNGEALDIRKLQCSRKTGHVEWINNFYLSH